MASSEGRQLQNAWRAPVVVFCPGEKSHIQSYTMVCEFSVDLWMRACTVVDDVLDIILSELKTQVQKLSENFEINVRFIRQASARQGLKIEASDEFDAIVSFKLKGLDPQEVRLKDTDDTVLPGQIRLRVWNQSVLTERFSRLHTLGVFRMDQGTCLINSKMLQEKVVKSLIDKALSITEDMLKRIGYNVTRGSRPPTMNIKISSNLPFTIDVDFVQGLYLGDEAVIIPDAVTTHPGSIRMNFPRFGHMKWISKENPWMRDQDRDVIWRNCSSSYERYMFDMCLNNRERLYIVTECHIMKAVVKKKTKPCSQLADVISPRNDRHVLHRAFDSSNCRTAWLLS